MEIWSKKGTSFFLKEILSINNLLNINIYSENSLPQFREILLLLVYGYGRWSAVHNEPSPDVWCITVVWVLSWSRLVLAKWGWRGCPDGFKEQPGAVIKLGIQPSLSWPTSNLGDKANSWSESNQLLTISHNPPAHHSQIKWWEHPWYQDSWDWSWQSQSPRASLPPGRIKRKEKKTIRQAKCNLEK